MPDANPLRAGFCRGDELLYPKIAVQKALRLGRAADVWRGSAWQS